MKVNKEIKSFKELMDSAIDESINESYATYGGTNALGTVQGASNNKYSPATVTKAPPIRNTNPAITMGQQDHETKAPKQLLYPFEGIFSELVDLYVRLEAIQGILDEAKKMGNLTDAKKEAVSNSAKDLEFINKRLQEVIKNIEEVTV